MSRDYEPTDSGWMWEQIKSLVADNTRLKDENDRLKKENQHMQARWDNWDNEQKKKIACTIDRYVDRLEYGPHRFNITVSVDEDLYRMSNIDYPMVVVEKLYKEIKHSMELKFSKPKEVTK